MNIWSIKNRWLRAAVAWLVAVVAVVIIAAICLVGLVAYAVIGAVKTAYCGIRDGFKAADLGEVLPAMKAAMTGKDEPK